MSLLERFIKYVKIDTMSMDDQDTVPSTKKQFDLANVLVDELKELGLEDVKCNDHAIVTATLPTNSKKKDFVIGFNAHLDTIPGFSGTNVNPQIIKEYDGEDIVLKNNVVLSQKQFPFMADLLGKTLITTDGTTVLGSDDKAGIANIMEMLAFFKENPDVEHTTIKVAFTPDEEIGGGIESFNVEEFGADFAYTVDGGKFDIINYECFNACSAKVHIQGKDIHPGSAYKQMINACDIGTQFNLMLPQSKKPMLTKGYEGFNHLEYISGTVTSCDLDYIIRNHDLDLLEKQKNDFIKVTNKLNKIYGDGVVTLTLKDAYRNMAEYIKKDPKSVDRFKDSIEKLGYKMRVEPIRGGTDGAHLTRRGLPTPNLGTGGYNCHGPYEFACLEEMELVVKLLIEIAKVR